MGSVGFARSLSVAEEAGNESFPLFFLHLFFSLSLSLFLVASGFSLSVSPFPVSYYLTAFPVFLAVLGSVLFH